jgi:hypothetical protein
MTHGVQVKTKYAGAIQIGMGITEKSIKLLWSGAGGHCSFPQCWKHLTPKSTGNATPFTLGEMAHICGDKPSANRHDPKQSDIERNDYSNLILLCPTHHRLIDRKENEADFSVAALREMKRLHEAEVLEVLTLRSRPSKSDVAHSILILLEANRQSWENYGPASQLARTQPQSAAAYAVWESERLTTIVPNNRKIDAILEKYGTLFDAAELYVVSAFRLHVRSYEDWVQNLIPYAAVKQFPHEFDKMIRELFDASK